MRTAALLVMLLLAAVPISSQTAPTALYMTDDAASTNGATDARLLSSDVPTGDPSTLQFSPVADVPSNTYDWVTGETATDDLELTGTAIVDLYFGDGLDAASTTTVVLIALAEDGTERELGRDTATGEGEAAAHQETLNVDVSDTVINEGEAILLRVSVTGQAAAVQLQYGGNGAESGITTLPAAILDTDGDGAGDSAERRAGTDPNDASDTPGSSSGGSGSDDGAGTGSGDEGTGSDGGNDAGDDSGTDGSSDDGSVIEPIIAAFLLLVCLALAGFALFGRFTT